MFRSSGKFELLDRIFPKLKRSGHRKINYKIKLDKNKLINPDFS